MNRLKNMFSKASKTIISIMTFIALLSVKVSADSIADSKLAKGTEKLIADVTAWLLVLAPVLGGVLIIYFFIRRQMADEMDGKKWTHRIITVAICAVAIIIASGLLSVISSYFV